MRPPGHRRPMALAALTATLLLILTGCYGQGGSCLEDEAPGTLEQARDLGVLGPALSAARGELLVQGVLQWEDDEDWYTFVVEDRWYVRWTPTISLVVLPEPGSGVVNASFAVNVYNHEGIYVGDASDGLTLKGSSFYDDSVPYYIQVRWRRPARVVAPEDTPTQTPPPGEGDEAPSPSPSPSPSGTPEATPTETPAPVVDGDCTRYVLRVRN